MQPKFTLDRSFKQKIGLQVKRNLSSFVFYRQINTERWLCVNIYSLQLSLISQSVFIRVALLHLTFCVKAFIPSRQLEIDFFRRGVACVSGVSRFAEPLSENFLICKTSTSACTSLRSPQFTAVTARDWCLHSADWIEISEHTQTKNK